VDKLLLITSGRQKGTSLPVTGDPISIGRDRRNTLTVDDEEVSRYHCEITCKNKQFFIEDLTSSNGTFVNEHMIRRAPLQQGDKIRIGRTQFKFDESLYISSLKTSTISADLTAGGSSGHETVGIPTEHGSTYYDIVAGEGADEAGKRFVQINNDLRFLYQASLATSRKVDAERMLNVLMNLVFDWINADQGYVFMKNADESDFSIRISRSRNPDSNISGSQTYQSIVQYVCKHQVGVLSRKPTRDKRWRVKTDTNESSNESSTEFESDNNTNLKRIGEVMCVPIQGRGELLGLIYVDVIQDSNSQTTRFNEDHLRLMLAIAHQAAVAIENESYYAALVEKERMAAVGETATLMSHRINNILQGINGGSHLVEVGLAKENLESVSNGWKIVSSNQSKISQLISDLLILGKPFEPKLTTVDIEQLTETTIAQLEGFFESEKVDCQFDRILADQETVDPGFDIQADSEALQLAIEGLIRLIASASQPDERHFGRRSVKLELQKREFNIDLSMAYFGAEICLDAEAFTDNPNENWIIGGIEFAVCRKIVRGLGGDISISTTQGDHRVCVSLPLKFL